MTSERTASEIVVPTIASAPWNALFDGEYLAVTVKQYEAADAAAAMACRLLSHPEFGGYCAEPGANEVKRAGQSLYEAGRSTEAEQLYFCGAADRIEATRRLAAPFEPPIDRFLRELRLVWQPGVEILRIGGRQCSYGSIRVFEPGVPARPHVDRADWDFPAAETRDLRQVVTVNVYLAMGDSGGATELWDRRVERDEAARLRVPGDYGLDRSLIGPPDLVFQPKVGDLTAFNATKIHAVRSSSGRDRSAQSVFLGFRAADLPLLAFS